MSDIRPVREPTERRCSCPECEASGEAHGPTCGCRACRPDGTFFRDESVPGGYVEVGVYAARKDAEVERLREGIRAVLEERPVQDEEGTLIAVPWRDRLRGLLNA
jgi:hypothetical protein